MPGEMIGNASKPYLRIVQGNFVQKADRDTKDARRREYETRDGEQGVKYELVYMNWTGVVQNISFKEGDYGTTCFVELEDAILCFNTSSRYFSDMASKLCGADLSKPIVFHPYDIEVDGKKKTGVSMKQDDEKLQSPFYKDGQPVNGFPVVDEEKKVKKSYWKIYFAEVEDFLTEQLEKLEIVKDEKKELDEHFEGDAPEPPLDDLPF